jgi:hypothetical protein
MDPWGSSAAALPMLLPASSIAELPPHFSRPTRNVEVEEDRSL